MFNRSKEQEKKEAKKEKICSFRFRIVLVSFSRLYLARDAGYRYTDFTPSTGTLSPAQAAGDTSVTWVGDASDVTFTVGATATMGSEEGKPGQIRFTKIEIFPAE